MVNIILTKRCNLNCPYCFANDVKEDSLDVDMTIEDFGILIKFLKYSNEKTIRLMGGEPTLHKRFKEILDVIDKNGFANIILFSNGIIEKDVVDFMKDKNIKFVLNLNEPKFYKKEELKMISYFLEKLGSRNMCLSSTIYYDKQELSYLIDYIKKFRLSRIIRIGFSSPLPSGNNKFILLNDCKWLNNKLLDFSEECLKKGIRLYHDCASLPLCNFNDEEIGKLFRNSQFIIKSRCEPPIDIGPGLNVWHCFTMHQDKSKLKDFNSSSELKEFYLKKFELLKRIGLFKECLGCKHMLNECCNGGCLANIFKSLKKIRLFKDSKEVFYRIFDDQAQIIDKNLKKIIILKDKELKDFESFIKNGMIDESLIKNIKHGLNI